MIVAASFVVRPEAYLAIVATAGVAGTIAALLSGRRILVPVVVIELVLGVVIGPHVLGLQTDPFITFYSNLGLALLFFFAGYEIDVQRIAGRPLRLALLGWALSLALGYSLAGVLSLAGVVLSALYTGSALSTTALGTLLPILNDTGEVRTRFGSFVIAAGAVGELGPILVVTLVLSADGTLRNALILVAFVATAVGLALVAARSARFAFPLFARTLESSSQLAVRWILALVFALVLLAFNLGLDLLLGGFAAGMIARHVLGDREARVFDSKLTAVAFGAFVPFFFIVSGMTLDLPALFATPGSVLKMALFFLLFLVVRGVPVLLLYRGVLAGRDRMALALMSSTQLPLVLAITTLAVADHHMTSTTAAALVGGAVLSTLCFPILGLRLRHDLDPETEAPDPAALGLTRA